MKSTTLEIAGLTTRIVEPASGDVSSTVVLLHGFGAPGDDLVALAPYLHAPRTRFVFPAAPLELGGLYGDSRAWWLLDLARLEASLATGNMRAWIAEVPEGLENVRVQMVQFLDQLQARYSIANDTLVLGGFSQGAMLSVDTALHRDAPLAGLVLMSGTLTAESIWQPRFAKLAGVPILQSHGRHDMLLPYAIAEALRDRLVAAGAKVEFHSFLGQHEIPPAVLSALTKFLASRAAAAAQQQGQ
ncbi:MAG: alpha/beta hydrolase [Kofleriaceae bacterium]